MVIQEQLELAGVYGDESRARGLYIVAAHFDASTQTMHVKFKAGMTITFPKARAQALANATDDQLSEIQISPAGWSVDFPRIDDGLTVEGILAGRFGNDRWEREWAERHQQSQAA